MLGKLLGGVGPGWFCTEQGSSEVLESLGGRTVGGRASLGSTDFLEVHV